MAIKPFNFESKGYLATLASYNVFVHFLMGVIVAIPMVYAFIATNPNGVVYLHIVLCVPGLQLLMAQSFLGLCPYNTWSTHINTKNKKRAHWIMGLMSTALVFPGCYVIMVANPTGVNFYSIHGITGFVALVFTVASVITGVPALYAQPLSRFMPGYISKISHIIFGLAAFVLAAVSLCYSYTKNSFRNWSGPDVAVGCIVITAIFSGLLCINPIYTCYKRCLTIFK